MSSMRSQTRNVGPATCALCKALITPMNDSREHIVPNAIGGRRIVTGFICEKCNNTKGSTWDSALYNQLHAICILLGIRRQRGIVRPIPVETTGGETLLLHSDGKLSIQHGSVSVDEVDGTKKLQVRARTVQELRRMTPGIVRKYPSLDAKTIVEQSTTTRRSIDDALHFPLRFGGHTVGRSIVKSVMALASDAGVNIDECEHAREYLLSDAGPCFGYFNDVDVVDNRPSGIFFHCVFVHGDPANGRIVGYVEYFGYQRVFVCLSNSYKGEEFERCYAIDPVSGRELDLKISVSSLPTDTDAVYEYKRVSRERLTAAANALMEYCVKQGERRVLDEAVREAWTAACEHCGVSEGDELSEVQAKEFSRVVAERIAPAFLQLLTSRQFTAETWRHILQTIKDAE